MTTESNYLAACWCWYAITVKIKTLQKGWHQEYIFSIAGIGNDRSTKWATAAKTIWSAGLLYQYNN